MRRQRVRQFGLLAMFLAVARPAAAEEAEPFGRTRLAIDAGLHVGGTNAARDREPLLGLGLHLGLSSGRFAATAGVDLATMFVGCVEGFFTVGAGVTFPAGPARITALALAGINDLDSSMIFDDGEGHHLKTVGLRLQADSVFGEGPPSGPVFAATGFFDLDRKYDEYAGGRVGGVTVLLTLGLRLGN